MPTSTGELPLQADPPAWDGASLPVQAGTTLTLALPSAEPGHLPALSVAGWPEPVAALLFDGNVAARVTIPATAFGSQTLVARWPGGTQGSLRLVVGTTVKLASGLGKPDDVAVAPDGSVLYTDLRSNTVGQLLTDGSRRTLLSGLNVPEGLAVTGPDTLLLADQGTNRALLWSPTAGLRALLRLPVRPGAEGIDGLGSALVDGQRVALLPDSANGRMLLLRLDTLAVTTVAGHWQRPTGADVHGGLLYLVDEYGGRLWRGPLSGPLTPLGPVLRLPDDVAVASDGTAFVNELGQGSDGGSVMRIDAAGNGRRVLIGLHDPQGLALDGAGNLVLAESGTGAISADIRTCLPLLLGSAHPALRAGGPAQAIPLGADCAPGVDHPTFTLAPGATWPAPRGTTWPVAGPSGVTLPNGVTAALETIGDSAALLVLRPPAQGTGIAILAVQLHVGTQAVPRQVEITVQR